MNNKIIAFTVVLTLCVSFLINSVNITRKYTRRTADELVKISGIDREKSEKVERDCVANGGKPYYYGGHATDCDYKK